MIKQVDMLPLGYIIRNELYRRFIRYGILTGFISLSIVVAAVIIHRGTENVESSLKPMLQQVERRGAQEIRMSLVGSDLSVTLENYKAMQFLMQSSAWSTAISEVSNITTPTFDLRITEVKADSNLDEVAPSRIDLRGRALTDEEVTGFVKKISKIAVIDSVELKEIRRVEEDGRTLVRYTIELKVASKHV